MDTKPTWHKIAENISEINFNSNGLAQIEINGKVICIAKHNHQLFACSQKCPHAGGLMVEGYIDAMGNLVCPLHKYRFSLKNGSNTSGEGFYLKTFGIKEKENGVFICIEPAFF